MSGMGTTTVFSLPRGQGRFYYMGLDFDNDPRDGSWGKLLTSIAEQAVSNPPSVNGASSPPVASPPPSSVAAAPEESELYNTSLENVTGTIFWPVGRGRVSYTAAGLTASSALTSPPSPAAPRASYLCHDLLVNGSGAAAANGSSTSASGGGAWVVIDLGTRRRVTAVRIQALEAGYDASIAIQGVAVGLEVRVGPTPANAATEPAYVNDPLCPALEPVIVIGASVVSGTAAVDVSCGAKNTLVGRYVSVQLRSAIPGATWARLCGVEVVGSLPASYALVSRNKPVCVDGYAANSVSVKNVPVDIDPSLAVDGLYNDNRNTGVMCALSVLRQDPFFTLDLGVSMAIERVEVTKSWRPEYDKQLTNFSIVVGLMPCSAAHNPLNDLVTAQAVVCASGLSLPPGSTGVYNCSGISGRYVTIATQGYNGYLRLCELDVYAAVPSSAVYRISVHKPVTASADYLDSLLPGQAAASNKSVTALLWAESPPPRWAPPAWWLPRRPAPGWKSTWEAASW
ncbi:hypothetical protein Vafri_2391 [Volvox africanus]|nr:hypothetical protein Vafri_2391 [Volvox africanus]